jgi:glycosyltransferase involved in cell wall biosynthesis
VAENGDLIITRKFIDGMACYAALWKGKSRALVRASSQHTDNLDNIRVRPADLPFELRVLGAEEPWENGTDGAAVVLAPLGIEFTDLAQVLRVRGVPLVYITELSLRTRLQIVRSLGVHPLRQLHKFAWEARAERTYRKALGLSQGVQCNGTPTFRAYQAVSPDAMLYFDSRSTAEMLATPDHLTARFARSRQNGVLRLAFSGRLIPIKGVDHLVPLAAALRARNVPFTLSIYGAGQCEAEMRRAIAKEGLEAQVTLGGNLDFATELTPRIRDTADLFLCCHRQGDPSCTYLETMSVGVPVLGYANEAFAGLLEHVDAGRATPMDDVQRLADAVTAVARDRDTLELWSQNALRFAREHTFEQTFERRIDHARRLARR